MSWISTCLLCESYDHGHLNSSIKQSQDGVCELNQTWDLVPVGQGASRCSVQSTPGKPADVQGQTLVSRRVSKTRRTERGWERGLPLHTETKPSLFRSFDQHRLLIQKTHYTIELPPSTQVHVAPIFSSPSTLTCFGVDIICGLLVSLIVFIDTLHLWISSPRAPLWPKHCWWVLTCSSREEDPDPSPEPRGRPQAPCWEAQGSLGGGEAASHVLSSSAWTKQGFGCSCAPSDLRVPPNFRGPAMLSLIPRVVFSHLSLDSRGALLRLCSNYTLTSLEPSLSTLSSVQLLSRVWLFATPWITARQASLSITNSWSLLKHMSIESVMPSNHLILCHPLLLPSVLPNIREFSNESVLHIRWTKY